MESFMSFFGWFLIICIGIITAGGIIASLVAAFSEIKAKEWGKAVGSIFTALSIIILMLFLFNSGHHLNILPAPQNPEPALMWCLFIVAATTAIYQAITIACRIVGAIKSNEYRKAFWQLVCEVIWFVACESVYSVYFAGLFD